MKKPWTIAIDGPAGAGKSTVARHLAQSLGFLYIDSGAMYRAVALLAHRNNLVGDDDADTIAALARAAAIRLVSDDTIHQRVFLGDEDVTEIIRTPEIASLASVVSAIPGVRNALVQQQQMMGKAGGVVMEGRDIGTVVFPDAELKIFLTATADERALRRHRDLLERGRDVPIEDVRADQDARDERDSSRTIAPLVPAPDAVIVDSDDLSPDEVAAHILQMIEDSEREQHRDL